MGGKAGHRPAGHLPVDVAGTVGDVRTIQILLGYAKINSTGLCRGVDVEDVFALAVRTEV